MNLTGAQLTTLAADVNAQGTLATARTQHDAPAVANFYNAAGAVQVWNPGVSASIILATANWTSFAALTVAKQNTFFAMTSQPTLDATNVNIRNGFSAVFAGADLTALSNIAQRLATKIEALLGSGGPPIVCQLDTSGVSIFGQPLDAATVAKAMGW